MPILRALKMSWSAVVSAFFLTFLTGHPVAAQAADLRMCYNDWPPYVYNQNGVATGISVDIMTEASRIADITISFHGFPWNRCLEMVRQGEFDGVLDAAERAEYLQGPASFSAYTNTLWVHQNSTITTLDFDALSGKSIGLVSGYNYPQELMDEFKRVDARVEFALDDETNLRKLAFGRVSAIVADFASTLLVTRNKNLNVRAISPTHSSDHLFPSFYKERQAEQAKINAAIEALIDDGTVNKIYQKHLGVEFGELDLK